MSEADLVAAGQLDAKFDDHLDGLLAAMRPVLDGAADDRAWGALLRDHLAVAGLTPTSYRFLLAAAMLRIKRWEQMP
jgi:hypothetical protein